MLVQHKQQVQQSNDKENKLSPYNLSLNYYIMLQNINLNLINQDLLKAQIEALEGGYVETIINLIK